MPVVEGIVVLYFSFLSFSLPPSLFLSLLLIRAQRRCAFEWPVYFKADNRSLHPRGGERKLAMNRERGKQSSWNELLLVSSRNNRTFSRKLVYRSLVNKKITAQKKRRSSNGSNWESSLIGVRWYGVFRKINNRWINILSGIWTILLLEIDSTWWWTPIRMESNTRWIFLKRFSDSRTSFIDLFRKKKKKLMLFLLLSITYQSLLLFPFFFFFLTSSDNSNKSEQVTLIWHRWIKRLIDYSLINIQSWLFHTIRFSKVIGFVRKAVVSTVR